ncbi:MAG: sensor histidine kinase [Merismopedia sp. SIO2A8]|nr:sensor histidine kinase [Merismopedia sp. SIO2A8]
MEAVSISIATDALIQWALQSGEILSLHVSQLTNETRQWLDGGDIGQVLAIALRTDPAHCPLGLLLVADVAERFWSNYQIEVLEVVGRQLAWSRRYLMLTEKLTARKEELEQLNWYKHRSLEYLCWTLSHDLKRLNILNPAPNGTSSRTGISGLSTSDMRSRQLIQQMGMHLNNMRPLLMDEQWQVSCTETTIPLVSLLKRAIARVDPLIQQRKLWTKVHNELNIKIIGDIAKTELVLHEILAAACRRAPRQSGVDVWCRAIDFNWLELSITDQGSIDSLLLNELHHGQPMDKLAQSWLDSSPGLELSICQRIIQAIGGEFNLYALEDGRILSQMTLRIDNSSNSSKGWTTVSGTPQPTSI